MCKFLSLVSNGKGRVFLFNAEQRKTLLSRDVDSHAYICEYYSIQEDKSNKWEVEFFPKQKIIADQINTKDDFKYVQKWLEEELSNSFSPKELQLAAVAQNGGAIQFITNPDKDVQLAVVTQDGYAIKYITNPDKDVQLAAKR